MKFFGLGALAVVACLGAGTAFASEKIYDCRSTFATSNGFIGPQMVFFVDESKGTVRVLDRLLQAEAGGAMAADVTSSSEKAYRLRWTVENVKTQREVLDVSYRATLNHARMRYTIEAVVNGYDNDARGEGRCQIAK